MVVLLRGLPIALLFAQSMPHRSRCASRERLAPAFFPLEFSLLGCPESFQVGDNGDRLGARELPLVCRHGQPFRFVECIAPSLLHDAVQHGVGMLPGMPTGIVRRCREFAPSIRLLPCPRSFPPHPMTRGAGMLVNGTAG